MKTKIPDFDIIVDEADAYLASLDDEQRRPKFGHNGLPKTIGPFSAEEKRAAFAIFCPPEAA